MNTRIVMRVTSALLGVTGLALTFAPGELLRLAGAQGAGLAPIVLQLLGAACLGFAFLDWMSRDAILGGIYGRPVVVANFTHLLVGGLALVKGYQRVRSLPLLAAGVVCLLLAAAFARMLGRHPLPDPPHTS